jgi:hypothetical protein
MVPSKGDRTFHVFLYLHFSHPISAPDLPPEDLPAWNVCQKIYLSSPNGVEIGYTLAPSPVVCESAGLSSYAHHLAQPPALATIS